VIVACELGPPPRIALYGSPFGEIGPFADGRLIEKQDCRLLILGLREEIP
jgi:hypothetical protein